MMERSILAVIAAMAAAPFFSSDTSAHATLTMVFEADPAGFRATAEVAVATDSDDHEGAAANHAGELTT